MVATHLLTVSSGGPILQEPSRNNPQKLPNAMKHNPVAYVTGMIYSGTGRMEKG